MFNICRNQNFQLKISVCVSDMIVTEINSWFVCVTRVILYTNSAIYRSRKQLKIDPLARVRRNDVYLTIGQKYLQSAQIYVLTLYLDILSGQNGIIDPCPSLNTYIKSATKIY